MPPAHNARRVGDGERRYVAMPMRRSFLAVMVLGLVLTGCSGNPSAGPRSPSPAPVGSSLSQSPSAGSPGPSLPPTADLIAFHSDPGGRDDTYAMNPSGAVISLTDGMETIATPYWSPDGTRLVIECCAGDFGPLYVLGTDGSGIVEITPDIREASGPAWSPDGASVAFESVVDHSIYSVDVNGPRPGQPRRIVSPGAGPAWSPDGSRIAYFAGRGRDLDIYSIVLGSSAPVRLTASPGPDYSPRWSPDGRWIAFVSERDGDAEIYVMAADGTAQRNLSKDPAQDDFPTWSPDGSQLAYVSFRRGADPHTIGEGNAEIFLVRPDGSGKRNLTRAPSWEGDPAWSPDGRSVAFTRRTDHAEIFVVSVEGGSFRHLPGLPDGANDCCPAWRPR
jgi:Tol biopolymer transport system component